MTLEAAAGTTIARPIEGVWAELSAVERFPEWLVRSGITRVERPDGEPLGNGARLRLEQRLAGRTSVLEGRITAWDPPHRLGLEARHPDGIVLEVDATLAGDGATTRLDWTLRVTLPLRLRPFESMARPEVRRAAAADLGLLKRRLESVAG